MTFSDTRVISLTLVGLLSCGNCWIFMPHSTFSMAWRHVLGVNARALQA